MLATWSRPIGGTPRRGKHSSRDTETGPVLGPNHRTEQSMEIRIRYRLIGHFGCITTTTLAVVANPTHQHPNKALETRRSSIFH